MEEKIRLAVFGQKRLSREGGIEIVVKELCTRMAQNGCDITCYNRAGHHVSGAEYDKTIEYDGIRQKVVPTIEKKGLAAVSSSFFAALCSAFGRYDVVHIHAEGPAFFCWIPKLFGKRVINTIHGLDWDREKWRGSVASKFIRGGEKNAVKYADEIIVLSKDVQKYFLETYGRETHFIPNGVNRPEVREAKLITDHFGLEKDSYILFLGRLVPEKGIRYLVEAFKNVKTDKKLVIAGGSSDTDMPRVRLQDEGGRTVQRYVKDYRITQDMAKKLCKLHHTAIGAAYRPQPFDWDVLLGLLHKKPPRRGSYEAQLSDADAG